MPVSPSAYSAISTWDGGACESPLQTGVRCHHLIIVFWLGYLQSMYISSITKCSGDNLCFSQMTNYCFPKNWKALAGLENSNIKFKNAGRGRVYLIPSSRPLQEMEPCLIYFQPMRHEGKGQLGNEMSNSGEGISLPTKVTKETTCSQRYFETMFVPPASHCLFCHRLSV